MWDNYHPDGRKIGLETYFQRGWTRVVVKILDGL